MGGMSAMECEINVSNLREGMEVKNYKEMCRLLGEQEEAGNTKAAQVKRWARCFAFVRVGQKYVIGEIYEAPKVKRKENSAYRTNIEMLLAYELSQKEGYASSYTRPELYTVLGMVKENFKYYDNPWAKKQIAERGIPEWQVLKFKTRIRKKLYDILDSALKSMKHRNLLDYSEQRVIVESVDGERVHREAVAWELRRIQEIERDVLKEMGHEKIPWEAAERNSYFSTVDEQVQKEHSWDFVYKTIKLVYKPEQIYNSIGRIRGEVELMDKLRENRMALNEHVITALNRQAQATYDKHQKLFDVKGFFGEPAPIRLAMGKESEDAAPYPEDFVENQHWLSEFFLRL